MKRKSRPVEIYTYSTLDEMFASPTQPTPKHQRVHQLTRMWAALGNIRAGAAPTDDDWRVCSDAVNLMETLVAQNIIEDRRGLLFDAITALATAGTRSLKGSAIRLDGPGIHAMSAVLEDYAACLEALPHRTMIQCHRATERRIREIFRWRVKPNDVVMLAL